MCCEVFDSFVCLGFLVRAVEVLKGKRHIVSQPLQEFGEFRCKRILFGGKKKHNANRLPTDEQWKCRTRLCSIAANDGVESTGLRVSQIVVADTSVPGPERGPAKPASLRAVGADRDLHVSCCLGGRPRHGYDVEEIAVGVGQADGGRGELTAVRCGLADQVEHLGPRLGPHDRFVGGAERCEHSCQTVFLFLGLRLFIRTGEVIEGERYILCKALQQLHQFGAERAELA